TGAKGILALAGDVPDLVKLRPKLSGGVEYSPLLFAGQPLHLEQLHVQREASDGVYAATVFTGDKTLAAEAKFVQSYEKKFGERPDIQAALAYDSTQLLVEGLRRVK